MNEFPVIDIQEQMSLKGGNNPATLRFILEMVALAQGFSTPDMAPYYGDGNTTNSGTVSGNSGNNILSGNRVVMQFNVNGNNTNNSGGMTKEEMIKLVMQYKDTVQIVGDTITFW